MNQFDLFTVMRSRRLGNASFDRMIASVNDPAATEAERTMRKLDYLSDLADECQAAGLNAGEPAIRAGR